MIMSETMINFISPNTVYTCSNVIFMSNFNVFIMHYDIMYSESPGHMMVTCHGVHILIIR